MKHFRTSFLSLVLLVFDRVTIVTRGFGVLYMKKASGRLSLKCHPSSLPYPPEERTDDISDYEQTQLGVRRSHAQTCAHSKVAYVQTSPV